jgi:hypothetical protein
MRGISKGEPMKISVRLLLVLGLAIASVAPATAGQVDKSVPFKLDTWTDLNVTDGPVTLHRIRLAREEASVKSRIMRPANSEFLQDVQIQLEFSNEATKDWKARINFTWLDAEGKVIDGYDNTEGLDDGKRHDEQTVTLSTLKYGLDKARTLKIHIEFYPD